MWIGSLVTDTSSREKEENKLKADKDIIHEINIKMLKYAKWKFH